VLHRLEWTAQVCRTASPGSLLPQRLACAWVPPGCPRPVSTGGRPFPPRARPPVQEASTGEVAWPWRGGAGTARAPPSSGAPPPPARQAELGRGSCEWSSAAPSFAPARLSSLRLKASSPWARRSPTTMAPRSGSGPDPAVPPPATSARRGGDGRAELAAANARRAGRVEVRQTRGGALRPQS